MISDVIAEATDKIEAYIGTPGFCISHAVTVRSQAETTLLHLKELRRALDTPKVIWARNEWQAALLDLAAVFERHPRLKLDGPVIARGGHCVVVCFGESAADILRREAADPSPIHVGE